MRETGGRATSEMKKFYLHFQPFMQSSGGGSVLPRALLSLFLVLLWAPSLSLSRLPSSSLLRPGGSFLLSIGKSERERASERGRKADSNHPVETMRPTSASCSFSTGIHHHHQRNSLRVGERERERERERENLAGNLYTRNLSLFLARPRFACILGRALAHVPFRHATRSRLAAHHFFPFS